MVKLLPYEPPRYKGICWECQGISSLHFFEPIAPTSDYIGYGDIYGTDFRGSWNVARKGCALCDSLLAHFGVSNGSTDDKGDSSQLVNGRLYTYLSVLRFQGTSFLCIEMHGSTRTVYFFKSGIMRSVPENLHDIPLAKSWISRCLESHEKHCGHGSSSQFPLKVVDCNSRELCEIEPGTPYFCLSYVWGNAAVARNISSNLSERLPKTIEDSIWVTLQLGYSYLWIDRYCINQQNEAEKHHLIMNMGAVYRGATLTIIAAAGDNPHSGLPGINGTPRHQLYSYEVGPSNQTIGGLNHPRNEIRDSVWNTRGWTYQELILSRRRLVFTESQMYFQCNSMRRMESLSLQDVASHDNFSFYLEFDPNKLTAFHDLDTKSDVQTVYEQIKEYYRKNLSFREDTIKAVTGVINAFEFQQSTDQVRITHVFGLPVFYSQTSPFFRLESEDWYDFPVHTPTSTFLYGLTWWANAFSDMEMEKVADTLFPSWSWASSKARQKPTDYDAISWHMDIVGFSCERNSQVWLHDKSQGSLELDHYVKACGQEDDRSILPMVSIRSWAVSCNEFTSEFKDRHFWQDYPATPLSNDLVAIFLGSVLHYGENDDQYIREVYLLLVEKVDGSTWRRVGRLKCGDQKDFKDEDTLTLLNRVLSEGDWEMRTLCLV
jgi:hypothetical protein